VAPLLLKSQINGWPFYFFKSKAATQFEDGATGAAYDIVTRKRLVPALSYTNPNPRGRNYVRFDGIDGKELIDRKFNVTTKSKQISDLRRMSNAIAQNAAAGYTGVIEVPNKSVMQAALRALKKAGVKNLSVRVAP